MIWERKGEGKRDRKINDERGLLIGCLLHALHWGSSLQPVHVPWPGIELWFISQHSVTSHAGWLAVLSFNLVIDLTNLSNNDNSVFLVSFMILLSHIPNPVKQNHVDPILSISWIYQLTMFTVVTRKLPHFQLALLKEPSHWPWPPSMPPCKLMTFLHSIYHRLT